MNFKSKVRSQKTVVFFVYRYRDFIQKITNIRKLEITLKMKITWFPLFANSKSLIDELPPRHRMTTIIIIIGFSNPPIIPGQSVRADPGRRAPEINRTWTQYSGPECLRIFPVTSNQLLSLSNEKRPEIIPVRLKYCFHIPSISESRNYRLRIAFLIIAMLVLPFN